MPAHLARAVLAAHGLVLHVAARDGLQRLEHLDLLVAHRLGIEAHRRLHRHQTEQLQQVVLQHVAHGAGVVVIAATILHAQGFGHGDLDVVDVGGPPDRLEQCIGEAQRHEVLHRLLAQVMVDPVDARFGEHLADGRVDRARRLKRMADGFFQHDACVLTGKAHAFQVGGDGLEQVGRGGQVMHPHPSFGRAEVMGQTGEFAALRGVDGEIIEARGETLPDGVVEIGTCHLGAAVTLGQADVGVAVDVLARQRQDAHVVVQAAFAMQVIEGRNELV